MEHLHPNITEMLLLPDDKRINFIQSEKWIEYPAAEEILMVMEELLNYPKSARMPGLLIVGETNNGKTALLKRFIKTHPITLGENEEGLNLPVVSMQAPYAPEEKLFYNNLMEALNLPYRINDKTEHKHRQIIHVMKETKVKILIIDEIHHLLSGSPTKQRGFLNLIKYIANELCISIACAGTRDAMAAIGSEPQLSNRLESMGLLDWRMDNDYLQLLASFESVMPLKNASNLYKREIAGKILTMSEGKLGEISNIIKRSAEIAIKDGTEKITTTTLDKIRFTMPDKRRRFDSLEKNASKF